MTGSCLAFTPCRDCTHKEMCSICELTLFKSGALTPQNLPQTNPSLAIGDVIYAVARNKIQEYPLERIGIDKSGVTYAANWHGCGYELFTPENIDKNIFLTREEAEQALKGAKNGT